MESSTSGPCVDPNTGMIRPHYDHWIWEGGVWTDKVQCGTCGRVEVCVRPLGLKAKYHQEDSREPWRHYAGK